MSIRRICRSLFSFLVDLAKSTAINDDRKCELVGVLDVSQRGSGWPSHKPSVSQLFRPESGLFRQTTGRHRIGCKPVKDDRSLDEIENGGVAQKNRANDGCGVRSSDQLHLERLRFTYVKEIAISVCFVNVRMFSRMHEIFSETIGSVQRINIFPQKIIYV